MIIVRLRGGLGNQMFQYAAGRRLALVNKAPLKLDLQWFEKVPPGDTERRFELGIFAGERQIASPEEIRDLRGIDTGGWPKLAKAFLKRTGLMVKRSWVREKHYHFDPEVLDLRGDFYLDGYWHSESYFADARETIVKDFALRTAPDAANRECAGVIEAVEAVSMHIRRGDYVTNPAAGRYHGVSPLEYYQAAVAEVAAKLRAPHFFAFSDDPDWVKANLRIAAPLTCVEHNGPEKAYEDLRLMTLCRHHIIANSSFSWWGAWLSRNPEKIVVAPRRWFNSDEIDTRDLIPASWLRL
jgi:hypothetical protein